ncbi:SubName: Full=Related to proteophosphoglycan ppg4-Leishmania major strain Friedlin {ECO:0000313/EMBL:CCA68998.1} [Serendipita indica DSM 11827]|nr:SubName: Full=Related to proteophosphoglycan ppg4-Leishmania major strain Friedlin {ECO:0000313/EMBL:CCA68998.1} [Serendipita indica DSM 11827]
MNRPSLSKRPAQSSSSPSKPSLESSVYAKLHDALALLPQRRSSPTKPTSSTQAIRKSPFSIFSSSRHKQSASSPAQLSSQQVGKPVPPQKPVPTTPPPVPPKSAPASRTVTPMALAAIPATVASTPLPSQSQPSQPSKSRPTIPFIRSSTLMQPTAASSARLRPAVSSPSPSSASTIRASTHTRTLSKSRPEPPSTPLSPTASSPSTSADGKTPTLISSRSRMSPSPTHELKASSPTLLSRPRPAHRTPTSPPPSAFPIKSAAIPPRSLPRKRSKTFPDPSDPAAPVPPPSQTASRSMNTANRIIEAFEPSPRMNDAPEPFSPRSKSTSPIPIRPPRPSQDTDFRLIPSSSRASASHRIVPSTSSIEAAASRPRPIASSLNDRSNAARGVAPLSTSAPNGRSSLDRGLPPPPRKAVSPTLTSTGAAAQKRRLARPILQPIQTTPITSKNVSTNAVKPPSPVTPDTQPSSPSPRTPAPYVDAMSASAYLTSDDETKPKRRPGLKNIFRRPMARSSNDQTV